MELADLNNHPEIPKPYTLNLWKHHLQFVIEQTEKVKHPHDIEILNKNLKEIGDSIMDLYTGNLLPRSILQEITESLITYNLFDYNQYVNWINSTAKKFRKIFINDGSFWILRTGTDKENFIHIHPGKYSKHTIRVRSKTLKTAILFNACRQVYAEKSDTIEMVNLVRKKFIYEPPLKKIIQGRGLSKILKLIDDSASYD